MSDIRDFVMAEPLVDNHEHQGGFGAIEARTSKLNYQEFVGYAGADMATAAGPAGHGGLGEMTPEQFFELWSAVRTTGYGQASELACRAILGLDYTAENVDAIADDLRALCDGKSGADIYDEMMEKAGIRWGLNDACWETPRR